MRRALVLWCSIVVASCSGDAPEQTPSDASVEAMQDTAAASDMGAGDTMSDATDTSGGEVRGDTTPATDAFAYVGCASGDIEQHAFDEATGALAFTARFAGGSNPSFLAKHPTKPLLYAVNEGSAEVAAFSILTGGSLALLNRVSSSGNGPAFVSVDATGKYVLVANYGGGTVAVLAIEADGKLGAKTDGDAPGPKAHAIRPGPGNKFVYAPVLGADAVFQYAFDDKNGSITPLTPARASVATGAGPRHIAFAPSGKYAWVINELNDTVTSFVITASGALTPQQSLSTLPPGEGSGGNTGADIHVHPSGKWLYASNRGHNSIAVFAVAPDGKLTLRANVATGGSTPRNFAIAPSGRVMLVANLASGNVVTFAIDADTGALTKLRANTVCGSPSFVTVIDVAR